MSYKRAGEIIETLRGEVAELVALAEEADGKGLDEGLSIPEEIQRREDRLAALQEARASMEQMYADAKAEGSKKGKKLDDYQHNFTDSDSRIMKAGSGKHFEQSYNAQLAVDTEGSMMIVGGYVTQRANDKKELPEIVASVPEEVRGVDSVSADSGFYSDEAVAAVEQANAEGGKEGPEVYSAVEKGKHGKTVDDLKRQSPMGRPPANMTPKEKMARKLKTKKGKSIYKKRKETVEPVFGIIKHVMGFRQFMLRGIKNVNTEWSLVRAAYNFKKLHRLLGGKSLPECMAYR